jgi:hypothetical protein
MASSSATRVSVCSLIPGVSLTFGKYPEGWRFVSWSRHDGNVVMLRPNVEDADRFFDTFDEAMNYFRATYSSVMHPTLG